MSGLGKSQAAVLDVRDPSCAQFEFEQIGMMSGSDKHCLVLQEDALLSVSKDLVADLVGLTILISTAGEARRGPGTPSGGDKDCGEPLFGFGPDRVRHVEDLLARSVVDVQNNGPGTRGDVFEVQYVARFCGSERID